MENTDKHTNDIETLLKEIQLLKNPWVSVSERMPTPINEMDSSTINVLIYSETDGIYEAWYNLKSFDWFCDTTERCIRIKNVSHWMPLPNPPKV